MKRRVRLDGVRCRVERGVFGEGAVFYVAWRSARDRLIAALGYSDRSWIEPDHAFFVPVGAAEPWLKAIIDAENIDALCAWIDGVLPPAPGITWRDDVSPDAPPEDRIVALTRTVDELRAQLVAQEARIRALEDR